MPLKKKLKTDNLKHEEEDVEEEDEIEEQSSDEESLSSEDDDGDDDRESEENETGEEEDDGEDGDEEENEEIQIDFEGRKPQESDLSSIRQLLHQKLGSLSFNSMDLPQFIVEQENIGTVIYQAIDEDEETSVAESSEPTTAAGSNTDDTIFGVLSAIDLKSAKFNTFSKNFSQFLLKESEKFDKANKTQNKTFSKLNEILKNKKVLYVVNERFINIPPMISVPMFENLLNELSEAHLDQYDYWLFLSKWFKPDDTDMNDNQERIYANAEEEVFEEFSEFTFEVVSLNGKASKNKISLDNPTVQTSMNVLLISKQNLSEALEKIKCLAK